MRRVFPLFVLTLTPFLANCADSPTPVAPASAAHSEGHMSMEGHEFTEADWLTDQPWWTPNDMIALADEEEEMSVQATAASAQPVVMVFGRRDPSPDAPPGLFKAVIRPHAVTIPVGGKVTFTGTMIHRVGIYAPGTKPQDIPDANPGPFVLYPVNRLFLQQVPNPGFTLTFLKPGKYLVLCVIKNHLFTDKQWGWIHVE
ncbi:hypothetical protein [Longimicrobium sp.]|uniref:hypothetical protein n=1 Tax=Longimicrobium sp. TaxID=2029185 RepID=UPI003B3B229F